MESKHIEFRGEDDFGRAVFYSDHYKSWFKSANVLIHDHKSTCITEFLQDLHTTDNYDGEPNFLVKQEIRDAFVSYVPSHFLGGRGIKPTFKSKLIEALFRHDVVLHFSTQAKGCNRYERILSCRNVVCSTPFLEYDPNLNKERCVLFHRFKQETYHQSFSSVTEAVIRIIDLLGDYDAFLKITVESLKINNTTKLHGTIILDTMNNDEPLLKKELKAYSPDTFINRIVKNVMKEFV